MCVDLANLLKEQVAALLLATHGQQDAALSAAGLVLSYLFLVGAWCKHELGEYIQYTSSSRSICQSAGCVGSMDDAHPIPSSCVPSHPQTWLRVALGYHTLPQVLVGYSLGSATALSWLHLGTAHVLPALGMHPAYGRALVAATYLASAAFVARNVLPLVKDMLQLRSKPQPGSAPT